MRYQKTKHLQELPLRDFLHHTRPELDRSGMGFAFMEAFMDEVQVESEPGKGTRVIMKKLLGRKDDC